MGFVVEMRVKNKNAGYEFSKDFKGHFPLDKQITGSFSHRLNGYYFRSIYIQHWGHHRLYRLFEGWCGH